VTPDRLDGLGGAWPAAPNWLRLGCGWCHAV